MRVSSPLTCLSLISRSTRFLAVRLRTCCVVQGSGTLKAGFAGADAPQVVFDALCVARAGHSAVVVAICAFAHTPVALLALSLVLERIVNTASARPSIAK